jgi:hypothetical protein
MKVTRKYERGITTTWIHGRTLTGQRRTCMVQRRLDRGRRRGVVDAIGKFYTCDYRANT